MSSLLRRLSTFRDEKVYSINDYMLKKLPRTVKFNGVTASDVKQELAGLFRQGDRLSIEKFMTVDFVKLRVLKDPDRGDTPLGRARENYIDQELLVPLKYPGFVEPRNRVISKKAKYTCVSEIVTNELKYFQTDEDTLSIDLRNKGTPLSVPAGTRLSVVDTIIHDKHDYLQCKTSQGDCHYFHSSQPLNFSAFPPHVSQTLQEVVDMVLPKIVKFDRIEKRHMAPMDDESTARLFNVINGPVKLLEVVSREFAVLRMIDTGTLGMIPQSICSCVTVMKTKEQPEDHYAKYHWSELCEASFYMIDDADMRPVMFPSTDKETDDYESMFLTEADWFTDFKYESTHDHMRLNPYNKLTDADDANAEDDLYAKVGDDDYLECVGDENVDEKNDNEVYHEIGEL